jgi:hypothetical protein
MQVLPSRLRSPSHRAAHAVHLDLALGRVALWIRLLTDPLEQVGDGVTDHSATQIPRLRPSSPSPGE